MKKVAVCISGHLRGFKKGYEKFHEMIISPNSQHCEFDMFIDTWAADDWRGDYQEKNMNNLTGGTIESAMNLYQPILLRIQKNIVFDTSKYLQYIKPGDVKKRSRGEHIPAMYYKIYKGNELKSSFENEFGFEYDLVIRHRSDWAFKHPLILTPEIFENIKNTVFIPHVEGPAGLQEWCPDVFAFSSSANMNYYSSLINRLDYLVEKYGVFRPEPLLYFHLNENTSFDVNIFDHEWEVVQ